MWFDSCMATLKELRDERLAKLESLKRLGVNPYPAKSFRNTQIKKVLENSDSILGTTYTVAGMIVSIRNHGKLSFIDIKDASGQIQLYLKEDTLNNPKYSNSELSFDDLNLLDTGDYVECEGEVTKTKTGQLSLEAKKLRILTKSLRPLPNQWDGLKDKETRLRRRYLDTKINEEVYQRFLRRAKFWKAHRDFFEKEGFVEMNIPVLENIPGGGDAKPFTTHMEAIDQNFFLRISQELPLKRLIGGGYERVYEIGPRFRNEGLSDEHLPEHMAMEFYWAYADWKDGMDLVKRLLNYVVAEVYEGRKQFNIRGFEVDFSKDWEIIDFGKIIEEKFGVNAYKPNIENVKKALEQNGVKIDFDLNPARGIDNLWKLLRKDIAGPAFLINHPKYLSPLQKESSDHPGIVERFQPIIAGSELGNGWSEVTDPIDQFERFSEQQALRDSGDEEAQWLDIDYVEMLEYGMPPTFGYGHSERTFWFLEDVSAREGVIFPQLKHEINETTREIYNLPKEPQEVDNSEQPNTNINSETLNMSREEALEKLKNHVKDEYQILHAKMVAAGLEAYAKKLGEDPDLWYLTGLLHDIDYFEHPEEHPKVGLEWLKEWGLPEALIHAVEAHAHQRTGVEPKTKLASALIAVDELSGFLYAYSLMRPEKWEGMKASSAKKKFKDKAFARKVDRDDIKYGMEKFKVEFNDHTNFLIQVFSQLEDLK